MAKNQTITNKHVDIKLGIVINGKLLLFVILIKTTSSQTEPKMQRNIINYNDYKIYS